MLERDIQKKVITYARERGCLCYKMDPTNAVGVPDYLVINPVGRVLFIEFKQLGKKPTVMQVREHNRLREHLVSVTVVDNVAQGKELIDAVS